MRGVLVAVLSACVALAAAPAAFAVPEGRGYELVTPADKNGGSISFPSGGTLFEGGPSLATSLSGAVNAIAPDGGGATFWSFQPFADSQSGLPQHYRSFRTAGGWTTKVWSPVPVHTHVFHFGSARTLVKGVSEDLTRGVIETGSHYDPLDQNLTSAFDGWDIYAVDDVGRMDWLSRRNDGLPDTQSSFLQDARSLAGLSKDARHVFIHSRVPLTPEADSQEGGFSLYERFDGVTRLVGADNTGALISPCGSVVGAMPEEGGAPTGSVVTPVSDDGIRAVFTVPDPSAAGTGPASCDAPPQVYQRRGNGTIHVSASQRAVPDPGGTQPARFEFATPDGRYVYFRSAEALTESATPGLPGERLYVFDAESGTLELIVDEANSGVGVLQATADGSRVYYGVVAVGEATYELRVSSGGQSKTVGAVNPMIRASGFSKDNGFFARISADGERLLFAATTDFTGQGAGATSQLYLYDDGTEHVTCLSCEAVDGAPLQPVSLGNDLSCCELGSPYPRVFAPSGERAVFQTTSRLLSADENDKPDVYLWDAGRLSLVSDGRHPYGSYLFGASKDLDDVFFTTAASLVPQDVDGSGFDLYDARVGGGFPLADDESLPCSGDGCQGSASSHSQTSVGSLVFRGVGNTRPSSASPSVRISKLKAILGPVGTLKVRVPGAGRISLRGVVVRDATKPASRAATYRLTVRLSAAARRTLANKGAVRARVTVAFRATSGRSASKAITVKFKRSTAGERPR